MGSNAVLPAPNALYFERATNAMTSRLLCSVLNSGLAFGHIVEAKEGQLNAHIGSMTTLIVPTLSNTKFWCVITKEYHRISDPVLAVPLFKLPIHILSNRIFMIDPEEFQFPIFHLQNETWSQLQSPASTIMNLIQTWDPEYAPARVRQIIQELENCVEHQTYAYKLGTAKKLPSVGDNSMAWEHSLIEGHPTHPMHKCRFGVPPMQEIKPDADMLHPIINFVAVPKSQFRTFGLFEAIMQPIKKLLVTEINPSEELIIPVHSYQVSSILAVFPTARILQYEERAEACLNLRTVQLESVKGHHFKLSCGMILGGGIRTISEYSCSLCETLEDVSRVAEDKDLLIVARDLGSVILKHPNPTSARQLSCIIREDPEFLCRSRGESLIVCAALIERDRNHEFVVNKVLDLNTKEKRWYFLETYVRLFLKAMVPPLYQYGVSFEAHPQNTLARFKKSDNSGKFELVGFLIRDYAGIKYNIETLEKATRIQTRLRKQNKSVPIELLHAHGFHSIISMHLHRIIRALAFHYCGEGWKLLRNVLDEILPEHCVTRDLWLNSESVYITSFITMKLLGKHSEFVFRKIPNFIHGGIPQY